MRTTPDERQEWLEADGVGGFASGTNAGIRTRRYHAILLSATKPPAGREVLVAGLDADVTSGGQTVALSSQRYAPGVVHPDGIARLEHFSSDPWPRWTSRVTDELTIEHSLVVPRGLPVTILRWRMVPNAGHASRAHALRVRLFLAGRDYHATHHENGAFRFTPDIAGMSVRWTPYDGVPGIVSYSNGHYTHRPDWYRNFEYVEERARGLDATEDLACPGWFEWDLAREDAVLLLAADTPASRRLFETGSPFQLADALTRAERRRRKAIHDPRLRAAEAYLVRRGTGSTIIAGYPWFTDWGRDTFIAIRGLCLSTGRYRDALDILLQWAGAVSDGMLPNRFPDAGEAPEFNAVDASLWFIVAAHELLQTGTAVSDAERRTLQTAIDAILDGYSRGTRFGIRCDADGLLAAGVPGVQLTWMDARVGDRVITPRVGKPVEIQALWINALWIASHFSERWKVPLTRASAAFEQRFWNEASSALYDVVDVDHVPGTSDGTFRPNQVFAIGGLPLALVAGERARRVVEQIEARLWTPAGLRSLAADEPGYCGRYAGGPEWRDGAYHQGTVWPWLLGPFIEAWVRSRGGTDDARREARGRFFEPLLAHAVSGNGGHLAEVADGEAPHRPGGCPFQAWSLGEVLRLDRVVLNTMVPSDTAATRSPRLSTVGAV